MTKTQRKKHVESLKVIVEKFGFKVDGYGNYKTGDKSHRVKFKKNNLRVEKKSSFGWFKLYSQPYIRIAPDYLNKILTCIKGK